MHWLRTTNITKLKVVIVSNKQNSLSQWIHPTRTEHVLFSIVELAATTICARDCFASEPPSILRWSAEQARDLIYGCNVGSAALDQAEAVITADAVVDLLNLEAEIIREGSDEPLSKKRRLLNNKIKVVLVGICRESMQLV